MRRTLLAWAAGVLALAGGSPAALSGQQVSPKTPLGIGVAPFEEAAPAGTPMPDVASQLAERIDGHPGVRGVGPQALGVAPGAGSEELARRSRELRLAAWISGRVTRLGRSLSLDARLFDAAGSPLATYVEEAADGTALSDAIDRLAERVARDAAARLGPKVSSPPPAVGAQSGSPSSEVETRLRQDGPIEIRSEELEVLQEGGGRRILFRGAVRARQEGVELASERLEAFYPAGARHPVRLEASGGVRVEEPARDRQMRCDRATYFRSEDRVICSGNAEMRQAGDRVRGSSIELALGSGRVRVRGGVELHVSGDAEGAAP